MAVYLSDFGAFNDVFFRLQHNDVACIVFRSQNHALRLDAHHDASLQIHNKSTFLAHKVFRLVVKQETCDCLTLFRAEVYQDFDEFFGAWNLVCFDDFSYAEIQFCEFLKGN